MFMNENSNVVENADPFRNPFPDDDNDDYNHDEPPVIVQGVDTLGGNRLLYSSALYNIICSLPFF